MTAYRPTREQALMMVAQVISQRGTCDRAQVGAVIARDGRPISFGYNGAPPGLPHCEENNHGWGGLEEFPHPGDGCRNATHAEANALAFAARQGISTDGATLFVTVAPCDVCSRLLIAAGIRDVFYHEEYRDGRGLELLRSAGIGHWPL
jgi:dCMP deaminase